MPQQIEMNAIFNGDMKTLLADVKKGQAFSYNGRPLPITTAFIQGEQIIAPLPHKTLIIDLSDAYQSLEKCSSVQLNLRFVR